MKLTQQVYGHGLLKNVSSKITGVVAFLSDAMFMTICSQLLSMLSCSYSSEFSSFNTGALLANPSIQCWTGSHQPKAVLALLAFSYYVPLCVMVAPMFMSTDPEKKVGLVPNRTTDQLGRPVCRNIPHDSDYDKMRSIGVLNIFLAEQFVDGCCHYDNFTGPSYLYLPLVHQTTKQTS